MSITFTAGSALLEPSLPAAAAAHASIIWHHIYNKGKTTLPPIAACAALAFFYAAYNFPNPVALQEIENTRNSLAIAGLLTVSIVPYTLLIMKPTNDALHAKSRAVTERSKNGFETILDDATKELIRNWNVLNFVRGALPLLATGLAAYAILFS